MNYYGFVSLFNGIVALVLGIYIVFTNRKSPLYQSFSFFSIAVAFWAISYTVWQSQTEKSLALLSIRICMAGCYFIPFSFLWFSRNITDLEPDKTMKLPRYFIIPAFFAAANATPWMIEDVAPRLYFPYWPVPGPLLHLCFVIFNLTVLYSFYLLFRAWFQSEGNRRWQLRWATVTTLFMWAGGSTNWFLWYNIPIPPAPNFFVAVFLLILAYAIVRKGLFDLDTLAEIVHRTKLYAIGMLAASLNHELRNPLYIAKGKIETHLDAVERGIYPESSEEIQRSRLTLNVALDQLTRAMDIMQRFSDFAKPMGTKNYQEKVLLKDTVQDVLALVSNEFQLNKIRVTETPQNGVSVHANKRQLEEIFFNLIINACHAMGAGGGELAVRASQPNGKVVVEVSDTGPGISKENHRRIFEPFYSTKGDKGSGLGLYITKQLVERNGGKISVKSRPRSGTQFILEFPRA